MTNSIIICGRSYNIGTKEYDTPGILVQNSVIDAITKKPILKKNKFVNLLTHPCYIIQVERLKKTRKTRLEKMLSIFDQNYKTKDKYLLDVKDIDEEFTEMIDYLFIPTQSSKFIRSLAYEEDIAESEKKTNEKLQKAEAEVEKQKVEKQKAEAEAKKQKVEKQKVQQKMLETARFLKLQNIAIDKISQMTGLSIPEIEKL